jgi:hypothetical protein
MELDRPSHWTGGVPLAVEISEAVLGGWMLLLSQIQEEDVRVHPTRTFIALLLTLLLGGL